MNQYESIIFIDRQGKTIAIFLREGDIFCLENIYDVHIYDKDQKTWIEKTDVPN